MRDVLTVPWVVAEESQLVQLQEAPAEITPAPAQPERDFSAPNWAGLLLTGALIASVVWLAGLAVIIIDGALFADPTIRTAWAIGGVPIITMLATALLADPNRNIGDDIYRVCNPVGQCTPSRGNTLTGRHS